MDAVEILTNLERVQPYFQPIFSADEHQVVGYELLGRFIEGTENVVSLGPFFHDTNIPEEYRLEVENDILEKALQMIQESHDQFLLFINRDPNLLMLDHGEEFLSILNKYLSEEQLGNIVLELSESNYKGNMEHLSHLLAYYKTYGIKLSLDNLGEESHLDRIGQLTPHILKVNLEALRYSGGDSYQDILYSLGMLARKMGSILLFENIETVYQLQFAWKNGGRYYQGFYLAKPAPNFINKNLLRTKFKEQFHEFITLEKKKLETVYELTTRFHHKLQELIVKYKKLNISTEFLKALSKELEFMCFRLYICDEDGFQKSPNVLNKEGKWLIQEEYLNKNWSWRPYFLENIIKMRNEKRGILSDLYSDIETGETIRTFSSPLNDSDYLFIDLSYLFLYENEVFL